MLFLRAAAGSSLALLYLCAQAAVIGASPNTAGGSHGPMPLPSVGGLPMTTDVPVSPAGSGGPGTKAGSAAAPASNATSAGPPSHAVAAEHTTHGGAPSFGKISIDTILPEILSKITTFHLLNNLGLVHPDCNASSTTLACIVDLPYIIYTDEVAELTEVMRLKGLPEMRNVRDETPDVDGGYVIGFGIGCGEPDGVAKMDPATGGVVDGPSQGMAAVMGGKECMRIVIRSPLPSSPAPEGEEQSPAVSEDVAELSAKLKASAQSATPADPASPGAESKGPAKPPTDAASPDASADKEASSPDAAGGGESKKKRKLKKKRKSAGGDSAEEPKGGDAAKAPGADGPAATPDGAAPTGGPEATSTTEVAPGAAPAADAGAGAVPVGGDLAGVGAD